MVFSRQGRRKSKFPLPSIAADLILRFMSVSVQNMLDAPVVDRCHRASTSSGGGPRVGISTLGSSGKLPEEVKKLSHYVR